jgi:hypothetical protein
MQAIHGGTAKNDRVDAQKIAELLRGGCAHRPPSLPRRCARPGSCSGAASTSCANGPSS